MIRRLARFTSAVLLCCAMGGWAKAQETFRSGSTNNNETFNGGNTSNRTGTQGVVGNPFCAPPHEIINGKDVTPLNWSCATTQQPYVIPRNMTVARPGPVPQPGASNPCQPGGPGGYNYLANPSGTPLPAGCVRPASAKPATRTIAKTDARYDNLPPGSFLTPPVGPPGSYLQPDGRPGSYLQPNGLPGSYLNSTGKGTQVHTGPGGAIVLSPGKNETAEEEPGNKDAEGLPGGSSGNGASYGSGNGAPYRQDTGTMRSGVASNGGASSYRLDTGAMQGGFNLGVPGPGGQINARKTATAKKPNAAAANAAATAQAAKMMNNIINLLGNGP